MIKIKTILVKKYRTSDGLLHPSKKGALKWDSKRARDKKRILELRKERDDLWHRFNRLPRRESFSGLHLAGQIDHVQQLLDKLENPDRQSKRYTPEITIEVGG